MIGTLFDPEQRDAFRLSEAGLQVAALGGLFSKEARQAAAEYVRHQAHLADEECERTVLNAIADYFEVNLDADGK
jgi:hypothetical protein